MWDGSIIQLDKLEFGGQWPLTMRARRACIRYFPNPLGIVTADQLDKLEFDGQFSPHRWLISLHSTIGSCSLLPKLSILKAKGGSLWTK